MFPGGDACEEVDDEREEVAERLRHRGCKVVPPTNPFDLDEVWQRAPEWVSSCDKFVQILGLDMASGSMSAGLVMYQHALAKQHEKPIYVYRKVERSQAAHYRAFLERFDRDETGGLESFVERVAARQSRLGGAITTINVSVL